MLINGEVWKDTDGQEIWCNGGQMLVEDGVNWWIGYETGPKRPDAIRLYSSADLGAWKSHGILISLTGEFAQFAWMGRPGLVRSRATGKYVIIFEADSATKGWFRHKVGYAVSDAITGPYRLASCEYPEPGRSTGDQSVFTEADEAFLVTVLDSAGLQKPINRSLAIYRLTPDHLHVESKLFEGFDHVLDPSHRGNEAPHIVNHGGTYYLFVSGLDWWNSTETLYAAAPALAGPWSRLAQVVTEPPSPDSFNTQHDFIIPLGSTPGSAYLYAGDRYSQYHGKGTGRNIFLPLRFDDGVPILTWHDAPPALGSGAIAERASDPGTWRARLWHRIVQIDAAPEKVAGGFAIGVFTGVTPTMGLGALIGAGIAALFRWNLAASVVGNIIGLPPLLFGVWAGSAAVGAAMFGMSYDEVYQAFKTGTVWTSGWRYVWVYIAGNAVMTVVLVPLSYWIVLRALQRHRAKSPRREAPGQRV